MSSSPADALLAEFQRQIPALSVLYDNFAHALDPFSMESAEAENVFMQEIAKWYDSVSPRLNPKPTIHEFRKAAITQCKRHLAASDNPPSKELFRKLDQSNPP